MEDEDLLKKLNDKKRKTFSQITKEKAISTVRDQIKMKVKGKIKWAKEHA